MRTWTYKITDTSMNIYICTKGNWQRMRPRTRSLRSIKMRWLASAKNESARISLPLSLLLFSFLSQSDATTRANGPNKKPPIRRRCETRRGRKWARTAIIRATRLSPFIIRPEIKAHKKFIQRVCTCWNSWDSTEQSRLGRVDDTGVYDFLSLSTSIAPSSFSFFCVSFPL